MGSMLAPSRGGTFRPSAWRGIARVLTPSFSDLFFIALIVWLFVWGPSGWMSLLGDGDTGWHIRTGQYILEHHSGPDAGFVLFLAPRRSVVRLGMADRPDVCAVVPGRRAQGHRAAWRDA